MVGLQLDSLIQPLSVGRVLGPADASIAEPLSVPAGVLFPSTPNHAATQFRVVRETESGTVHVLLEDTARLFPEYTSKDKKGLIKDLHPAGALSKKTIGLVTERTDKQVYTNNAYLKKLCTRKALRTCAPANTAHLCTLCTHKHRALVHTVNP